MTFKQGRFFFFVLFFSTHVLSHGCLTFKSSRDKKGKIKLALRYYLNCKKKQNKPPAWKRKYGTSLGKWLFFHSLWKRSNEIVFKTSGQNSKPLLLPFNAFLFKEVTSPKNEYSSDLKFPSLQKACRRSLKTNTESLSLFRFFEYEN